MKLTKRHDKLIRGPGGKFVSKRAKEDIVLIKQFNPGLTYAEISSEYFKANKSEAKRYHKTERDSEGQILSPKTVSDLKQAAKQLNVSYSEVLAKYEANKLIKSEFGRAPLHTVSNLIDTYNVRKKGYRVKIKLPGETRFRTFRDINRANILIEKLKAKIFKEIRKRKGTHLIPSDEIPTIPIVEKFRPGEFLPEISQFDFSKVKQISQLDDDEAEDIIEKLRSGEFSNSNANEKTDRTKTKIKNNSSNRKRQNK